MLFRASRRRPRARRDEFIYPTPHASVDDIALVPLVLSLALASPVDDAHTWEDAQLATVLEEQGLEAFRPEARDRVGFIRIVRHDVFTPDDPWPDVFNLAHLKTEEDVVARELLFAPGDSYDKLEETARNLRDMFIYTFVRVVPVRKVDDGATGALVFTRDLWSLRFEQGFQVTGTSIDRLLLQLTERNVLGRAKVGSVRFTMDPSSWSIGETWVDPRIWGSGIRGLEDVDLYFSRATGAFDGSSGAFIVGAPLLSLSQPWGFDLRALYDVRTIRQIQNGAVITWDAPSTIEVEAVPRVWGQRAFDVEASVLRQFAAGPFVHRITAGVGLTDDFVEPVAETALPPHLADEFAAEVLPTVRRTLFPFVAFHAFSPRFRIYEDLDTFGVSEAVRLGPSLSVSAGAGTTAALSSSDTVFATGTFGTALDPLGGLFEAAVEGSARWENGSVVNRVFAGRLRFATPPAFAGRFLLRADATFRKNDVTNVFVAIGGDNGLRGYPSQAFFDFGASVAQGTVEWRSLPIDLASAHVGVAAFYDVATLFKTLDDAVPHHSVGVGIRFLFPQLNHGVYRVDLAAPLDERGFHVLLSFGDTQAVEHALPAFSRLAPRR